MPVILGSERLLASDRLSGRRVGVVCNPASVDRQLQHIVDRIGASNATLAAIFGPQHGFRSDVQDNMIETRHAHDEVRRVPVYSLYSETREPTAEMLEGPGSAGHRPPGRRRPDLHLHLHPGQLPEGGARARVPVVVCDRPNPIGGAQVEGMVLVPASNRSSACSRSRCGTA
jgi:uncharacterized protein YbbC (DUF1343 family)